MTKWQFCSDEERRNNSQKLSSGTGSDGDLKGKRSSPVVHNGAYVGVSTAFNKGNVKSKNSSDTAKLSS